MLFRNVMFITAAVPRNCPVTFACPSTCVTGYTSGSDGCPLCACVGQQGKAIMTVLIDFSLTVKAALLILISGRSATISSAEEGKSGFIYNW